jgi:hypothetical protein
MKYKEKLIKEIWGYCQHTHNSADYEQLQTFEVDKLQEVLINIIKDNE